MKKKLLSLAAAVSVGMVANLAGAAELTAVSFGGAYGAAQQKHMIDPYMEKTGNKVLFENYSGGVAELKAQVESGNVLWDVVDMEVIDLERACSEGLLEVFPQDQLPPGDDGTPAAEDFSKEALANECGVGNIVWTVLYAYNHDTIQGGEPKSMIDFFDTKTFPGKRALRKRPQVNLEWALLADGVPKDQIYDMLETEEGQARAFAKLDTIKDDIVWFDSWSQAPQLLNDGGAVMVQSANGRFFAAITQENKPFEMVWDGHVFDLDVWAVVKGAKNKETAIDFVKFATGSKPLSGMPEVAYAPTRKSSAAYIDASVLPKLPSAHLDEGLKASSLFWADYGESLSEKFNEWLLK
ncbi:spermidine/putrescine ABC transporter substrate-binding protein [Marinobacterium zhoushanense]|uniref:Spermidine/putrescine ABC transporter substrate-binding protein n=1 Tax=Marinobacterium zhoushanense TaxID=1679163 RepID=A0ABQ1KNM3_9GAMM|nr:ABC transporter substrate-binding protein [Marinobacterium zhoushanense]GGC05165.1 spermidine/putrescine ABC transporter substrate-binding protein [Marinobacterium zhoushanense]